jgi:hypothetical protein
VFLFADVTFCMNKQKQEPPYVLAVGLNDVQLGRGRPVVTSEGNQRFRALILRYKPEYSSSNRHAHKDVVARKILSIISDRGGKFLRKVESVADRKKLGLEDGVDAWEVADEETSISKVKQALRENETSPTSAEDAPGSHATAGKTKNLDAIPPTEAAKRGADSDSGKSGSGPTKTSKKRRKSHVDTPISLADSIRANASKLGPDYSFSDAPATSRYSTMTAATATGTSDIGSMKSKHAFGGTQKPMNLSLADHKEQTHLDDHSVLNLTSRNEAQGDMHEPVNQNDNESFVRRTIASALAVSDDGNTSIHVEFATSDSRREDVHTLRGDAHTLLVGVESATGIAETGSSSDEDKKPAAL